MIADKHGIRSLVLNCHHSDPDTLTFTPELFGSKQTMEAKIVMGESDAYVQLDEVDIRELFNFLAVWLHGENRPENRS